jgi:DNA adenine methylase
MTTLFEPDPEDTTAGQIGEVGPGEPAAQPFIKWVGGKRQLLPALLPHVPDMRADDAGTYFEPFMGGAALFWAIRPKAAVLSDANERLVRTYRAVRDCPQALIERLRRHADNHGKLGRKFYMVMRSLPIDQLRHDADLAAWFIYLNRTCFNGVYRVNKSGGFNVPMGSYKNPLICDEANLWRCSEALQNVELTVQDFRALEAHPHCAPGAFVYFDPPYAPLSATADFTSYTAEGFGAKDQEAVRDLALRLKRRGVRVLISNSSAQLIRTLFAGGTFEVTEVDAKRAINSDTAGRGVIKELLIY